MLSFIKRKEHDKGGRKKKVVISLGGNVFARDDFAHSSLYANAIKKLSKRYELIVVVGGGSIARKYTEVAKKQGMSKEQGDMLGIMITRANALLFAYLLGYSSYSVPTTEKEAVKRKNKGEGIVVMGGTEPGQSTDGVSARIAMLWGADYIVNATTIDGVYDKDPNKYVNAKKISKLTYSKLYELLKDVPQEPGNYALFDTLYIKKLNNTNIKLKVLDGRVIENILNFEGEGIGSLVVPDE